MKVRIKNLFYYKLNTRKEKSKWHKQFAWFPVAVEITLDGDKKKIWLEYVYRCGRIAESMEGEYICYSYKEFNPMT